VDGQDGRFGGAGGATPPPDGYGFYAGAAAPQPQANQFGYAAAPAYGAPAAAPGAPAFGSPYTAAPPAEDTTRSAGNRGKVVVAAVLGLVALGGAVFGWNVWQQHQPIGVPASLGSLSQLHTPVVDAAVERGRQQLDAREPGKHAMAAAYGAATGGDVVVLVGLRGHLTDIQTDLDSAGATTSLARVGKDSCAPTATGYMCERTSPHLTEGVLSVSRTLTMSQVAAMLDEAWSKA